MNVYDPARFHRIYVQDVDSLRAAVSQLRAADALGVDLEMGQRIERKPGGYQRWVHLLALLQIASDDLSVVVDPLRIEDLSPLNPLMGGPVRKVFLGGGQDVALLEKSGIPARTIVDVGEVALGLFGRREDGMAALSQRIFGLKLDKTLRRTDWMVRPLHPGLITYAHQDAELTLLIYRWLREHYPDAVALHERSNLEPEMPNLPPWLQAAIRRTFPDPATAVLECSLDPVKDRDQLALDVREALAGTDAPRIVNRLLRVASQLGLQPVLDDAIRVASSPSAITRAAAARAIGQLADPTDGLALLETLRADPVEEVRRAADAAVKELSRPKVPVEETEEEPEPSLDEDTRLALQELMARLQGQPESET